MKFPILFSRSSKLQMMTKMKLSVQAIRNSENLVQSWKQLRHASGALKPTCNTLNHLKDHRGLDARTERAIEEAVQLDEEDTSNTQATYNASDTQTDILSFGSDYDSDSNASIESFDDAW